MSFAEIERDVMELSTRERRRLAALLVRLRVRDTPGVLEEWSKRLEETKADDWVSLSEAKRLAGDS